mgnify:CR=1 FL=1
MLVSILRVAGFTEETKEKEGISFFFFYFFHFSLSVDIVKNATGSLVAAQGLLRLICVKLLYVKLNGRFMQIPIFTGSKEWYERTFVFSILHVILCAFTVQNCVFIFEFRHKCINTRSPLIINNGASRCSFMTLHSALK